jgi:hypothetical protein
MRIAPVLVSAVLLAAAPVLRSPSLHAHELPPPQDRVVLALDAEGWVSAAKPLVTARVDAALRSAEAGDLRARVREVLGRLAPEAEWRITDVSRAVDEAGLERWHVAAEARLDEAALGGLQERAEQASTPGLQVRVETIDFSPSDAERAARMAELRADLYRQVKTELSLLAESYPERRFRVGAIDFVTPQPPVPVPMADMRAMAAPEMKAADMAPGFDVSQHLRLNAQVVLYLDPPAEDASGKNGATGAPAPLPDCPDLDRC